MKAQARERRSRWGVSPTKVARTLARREPGVYDIGGLLREYWPWEKRPSMYGSIFKAMVLHGFFPRVRWVGEKANGQALYEVVDPRRRRARMSQRCGEDHA